MPTNLMKVEEIDGKRVSRLALPVQQILGEHTVAGPDGVQLLALGEVDEPSKGCLCSRHGMVREIVGAAVEQAKQAVILDMEASLEHMRRGTVRHVDKLLIVTEPYYRALESAGRLIKLAREMGLKEIYGVANKVRTPAEEKVVLDYFKNLDIPVIAVIPFDESVTAADLAGKPVLDVSPNSPSMQAVAGLVDRLWA